MSSEAYSIRLADDGDSRKWNEYVDRRPGISPYHRYAWKQAVENAYGHRGYYLLAEKESNVVGILPLAHLHLSFLVSELTALPYCDIGNAVSDEEKVTALLLDEALKLGRRLRTKKLLLRGSITVPERFGERIVAEKLDKVRMMLQLPPSSETLLQSFKSKLRSQIRKAGKNGLVFRWGSEADVDAYYSVFSRNMHDLGSPVHSKAWFVHVLRYYGEHARMGLVYFEEVPVACGIILTANTTVSIPWASTLRSYNRLSPNMLLYWKFLEYAADKGFKTFDFGRSTRDEGTYTFKKQWGAKPVDLQWYSSVPADAASPAAHRNETGGSRQRLARAWSSMPLSLANSLGPVLRKYISL